MCAQTPHSDPQHHPKHGFRDQVGGVGPRGGTHTMDSMDGMEE